MKPDIAYGYDKLKQLRFEFKESDRKLFPNEYTFDYGLDRYVRVDGNDLYISKDTFKPLEEELEYADRCHQQEGKIGCPLDIVAKIMLQEIDTIYVNYGDGGYNSPYEEINEATVDGMYNRSYWDNDWVIETNLCPVPFKDYKKSWWTKKDRSE